MTCPNIVRTYPHHLLLIWLSNFVSSRIDLERCDYCDSLDVERSGTYCGPLASNFRMGVGGLILPIPHTSRVEFIHLISPDPDIVQILGVSTNTSFIEPQLPVIFCII